MKRISSIIIMTFILVEIMNAQYTFIPENKYIDFNKATHSIGEKFIIFDDRKECNILSGGMDISSLYYKPFDTIAQFMKKHKNYVFEIGIFTDCRGDENYNLKTCDILSEYILNYFLSKHLISKSRITSKSYASSVPFVIDSSNIYFQKGTILSCDFIKSLGYEFESDPIMACLNNKNLPDQIKMAFRYNRRIEIMIVGIN